MNRRKFFKNSLYLLSIGIISPIDLLSKEVKPYTEDNKNINKLKEITIANNKKKNKNKVDKLKLFVPQQRKKYDISLDFQHINKIKEKIDIAFKDNRRNKIKDIDIELVKVLYKISNKIGKNKRITIISGYRTKKTNDYLRRKSKKVAKHSYHIKGKAVDIRVPGISVYKLAKIARKENHGGIGKYIKSNFVHIDTGKYRNWNG